MTTPRSDPLGPDCAAVGWKIEGIFDATKQPATVVLEWVEGGEAAGGAGAPYPPSVPKMPGEPALVQSPQASPKKDESE